MNQTTATRVRWKVLAWLCSLSALTYITRIGIIQVQDRIELDLHLTPQRLAYAFSSGRPEIPRTTPFQTICSTWAMWFFVHLFRPTNTPPRCSCI
jgi:hypothetical protein